MVASKHFTLRIPEQARQQLRELSEHLGLNQSELIILLIQAKYNQVIKK